MRFVVACLAAMVGDFRKGLVGEMRVMDPLLRVEGGCMDYEDYLFRLG